MMISRIQIRARTVRVWLERLDETRSDLGGVGVGFLRFGAWRWGAGHSGPSRKQMGQTMGSITLVPTTVR
jgi:hypothetical protein